MNDTVMANLMATLFKARDVAHMWHWKVKSFAQHMALGDLYDGLLGLADELMEMYMGTYGTNSHVPMDMPNAFNEQDPVEFIRELADFLESQHDLIPQEKFLVSKFEELQMLVAQTLYKMENLH